MATFIYPDSTELKAIEQDLVPEFEGDDPVFFKELFPVQERDTFKLEWEQLDNFFGLQAARGLDGQPSRVARIGSNRYVTEPGVYGEFIDIDEAELSRRGEFAKFTGTVDLTDLTMMAQRQLLQRRTDRQRFLGWTLLTTGQFMVASPNGGYEHRDSYKFDTLVNSPGLSSPSTSAPFAFLLNTVLQGRGTSSAFDASATLYINQVTLSRLLTNTNASDFGGKYRIGGGNTVNNIDDINKILQANSIPQIVLYDKGYLTASDKSTFTPFIPNGLGVLIGKRRTKTPLGGYSMTLNVHNGFKPGSYQMVVNTFGEEAPGIAKCQIHDGHNGGPFVQFPSAVKILNLG